MEWIPKGYIKDRLSEYLDTKLKSVTRSKGIVVPDWTVYMQKVKAWSTGSRPVVHNDSNWGLHDLSLTEYNLSH